MVLEDSRGSCGSSIRTTGKVVAGLLGVTPATGIAQAFVLERALNRAPVSESPWLSLCEEKPEIFLRIGKFTPFKQTRFLDPLFSDYLKEHPVPFVPDARWSHSDMSDLAFQKAVAKYCRPYPAEFWDDTWSLAEQWLEKLVLPVTRGCELVSMDTVIRDSELATSPGPLWRTRWETKSSFLASDKGWSLTNAYWKSLSEPGGELTLWGSYLKDELRLQEKVDESKTRLFLIAPVEHHLAMSVMCTEFNNKVISAASRCGTPVAVGMNIYDGGYARLGEVLAEFPVQFFADVSGWDTRLWCMWFHVVVRLRFLSLRKELRTWENLCRLCNLYRDVIFTPVVLPDGTIVFLLHMPSGQLNTAMDNSLILTLLYVYAYLISGAPHDFVLFKRNVFLRCFGDDSVVATCDPRFSPEHVRRVFSFLGMEVEFSHYWEFLGHFICWDDELLCHVPVFPYHKVLASLCLCGKPVVSSLVSKAMSLRVLVYTNKEAFHLLDSYCQWLLDRFPDRPDFRCMYLPESEIRTIYKGRTSLMSRAPFKDVRGEEEACSEVTGQEEGQSPSSKSAAEFATDRWSHPWLHAFRCAKLAAD